MDQERFQPGAYLAPRYWPGWLALGVLRAAILMPYAWQCRLGRGLGVALYHLHRKRRRIASANIELCFPDLPQTQRQELVKETFRQTGITVFETPLAWWGDSEQLREHSEIEGLPHLFEALEHGKGVILLTGHSTSLEMGGRLLSLHTPVQAMVRTVRNKLVNAVTQKARGDHLARVIVRANPRAALRGLAETCGAQVAALFLFSPKRSMTPVRPGLP